MVSDYTLKYDANALKANKQNLIWLSVSFSFIYFGINTYKNFAVPLLGNLGSVCLGTLYTMAALANFLVPAILYMTKNELTCMLVSCFAMVIYILQYAYLIPIVAFIMCFVTGIFFAISWSVESILVAKNSVDENRAYNSNLFYGIFMVGNVFGNIFAYVLLDVIGVDLENRGNGWNGSISVLFIGLSISALIGSFLMFKVKIALPTSLVQQVEVVATEPQAERIIQSMNRNSTTTGGGSVLCEENERKRISHLICSKVTSLCHCLIQPRMLLLLFFFLNNGYSQILISAQVTRQITRVELIGLSMALFAITEVLTTVVLAHIADRLGHRVIGCVGMIAEICGLVATFYMNQYQGWMIFGPPVFFAIMDTVNQTECVAIIGRFFHNDIQDAAASYRLIQGIGSSICSFITPLFVTVGATSCTPKQLIVEMMVAGVLAVVSYSMLLVFMSVYKGSNDLHKPR